MRTPASFARAVLLLVVPVASLTAQQSPSRFDGAWRQVRTEVVSPDSTYLAPVWPGLALISGRYFSQIWVTSNAAGVQQASQPTTADQKAARYDVLIANAGTFEVQDTLLTFSFSDAKNPTVVGTKAVRRYRLRGDTLSFFFAEPWEKDRAKAVRTTVTFARQR